MNIINSGNTAIETKTLSLYNSGNYLSCLNEILDNYNILDTPLYKIMALCCILLNDGFETLSYNTLMSELKEDKMFLLLDAYNFFSFDSKYYGDFTIIENFCYVLISSTNSKCTSYVRNALKNVPGLNYSELAAISYDNNFYYLCDEILTIYCIEMKNDYSLLLLKARVLFKLRNLSECQKYIFYAKTLKNSDELCRLTCLCKILECIDTIIDNPVALKSESIGNALISLEDARKFLL